MNLLKGTGGILKKSIKSSQSEIKSEKKENVSCRSTSSQSHQKSNDNPIIVSKVKAIIMDKLMVDEEEVVESASFIRDLGADSLDAVELIMEFEYAFGISISDAEAERIRTVGDAIAYITKHSR